MSSCLFEKTIFTSCADKQAGVGGTKSVAYIFNHADLTAPITPFGGIVSSLPLSAGRLFKVWTVKDGINAEIKDVVNAESGIVTYQHTVTLRHVVASAQTRLALEELHQAEALGVIIYRASGIFEIFGWKSGLSIAGDGGMQIQFKSTDGSTAYTTILRSDSEPYMQREFKTGTEANTYSYLESLLI